MNEELRTGLNHASSRKARIRELSDRLAGERHEWLQRNAFFHEQDSHYLRSLVAPRSNVLMLGCGTGDLLHSLEPAVAVGVDFSGAMIAEAERRFPAYDFLCGDIEDPACLESVSGTFDYIIIPDTIGSMEDCQTSLSQLHRLCRPETRLIIAYHSWLWEPVLRIAEWTGCKMPQVEQNYLSTEDIANLMKLAGFGVVKREWRQLLPLRLWGLGSFVNRYIATLPVVRRLCLRNYVVGRSLQQIRDLHTCSVIVPCRNERGNVEAVVTRTPEFSEHLEIIFVEGHSVDGTLDEIRRVIAACPGRDIKVTQQRGVGKADATYTGFDMAAGDVVMILDADLTTPPEQLPRFWNVLRSGQGEYVNGSRLVYPMERDAMRFLNLVANRGFSMLFTWLLNQRYTDTLCGTKAMAREDYLRMKSLQGFFGDFDPFGDFFLIMASSKLSLGMTEIPVNYAARIYGETQIQRFRNGVQLLRMVFHCYRKLKAF